MGLGGEGRPEWLGWVDLSAACQEATEVREVESL